MSPLVFINVMEAFSIMMLAMVGGGFMSGFLVGGFNWGTLNISHLLFANDTLISCDVEQSQIHSRRALYYALKLFLA